MKATVTTDRVHKPQLQRPEGDKFSLALWCSFRHPILWSRSWESKKENVTGPHCSSPGFIHEPWSRKRESVRASQRLNTTVAGFIISRKGFTKPSCISCRILSSSHRDKAESTGSSNCIVWVSYNVDGSKDATVEGREKGQWTCCVRMSRAHATNVATNKKF